MTTSPELRQYHEHKRELRRAIERADAEWERGRRERDASGHPTPDIGLVRREYASAMGHLRECARLVRNDRNPYFAAERDILLAYAALMKRVYAKHPKESVELGCLLRAAEGLLNAASTRLFSTALDREEAAAERAS